MHTYSDSVPSLLQLFDEENPVHKSGNKFMFTTEGHVVSVDGRFRNSLWDDILPGDGHSQHKSKPSELKAANFSSNVRNALPGGWGRGSQDKQSPLETVLWSISFRNVKYLRSSHEKHFEQQQKMGSCGGFW